jgi:hypothetical protein
MYNNSKAKRELCSMDDRFQSQRPSFQATKKEPIDGSRTRLALQNTAGAALYCSRGFHQYQGV